VLAPRRLIALTNTIDSPLGVRADLTLDIGAGPELAVPATKSVSTTAALLLWAASLAGRDGRRDAAALTRTANAIAAWLESDGPGDVARAAERIARRPNVVVLGSDYGLPIALETALKLKEASYLHAEGFAAGEFRHGSIAMIDASYVVIGIVDADAFDIVERPLREVSPAEPLRYTLGSRAVAGVTAVGPAVDDPFNTLAWLVTAQLIALYAAARGGSTATRRAA